MLYKTRAVAEI